MLTNLNILFHRLQDAEYTHLLLEEFALYGLLSGLIFFAVGIYLDQDKCRIAALSLIVLCCGSAIYGLKLRERAMPRMLQACAITQVPVIKEQTKLRRDTIWVFYSTAGLAILALVAGKKLGTWMNVAFLVCGVVALVFFLWLHMKEAEVFHPNIKKGVQRVKLT